MDIGYPPIDSRRINQGALLRASAKINATATDPAHKSGSDHEFQYHRYLDIDLNGEYAVWHRWYYSGFDNRGEPWSVPALPFLILFLRVPLL